MEQYDKQINHSSKGLHLISEGKCSERETSKTENTGEDACTTE